MEIILKNTSQTTYLEITICIIELVTAILVLSGAIVGIRAVNKFKDKQLNAMFSFYARLKTKLKIIYDLFSDADHKQFVINNMLPQSFRTEDIGVFTPMEPIVIQKLSDLANDTLKYLMTENNQMPISENWNEQLDILLELLQDLSFLKDEGCFKWTERDDETIDKYFSRHSDNLKAIIKAIEDRQSELTKKYLKLNR